MIVALTALLGAALYAAAGYGGVRAAQWMVPQLHRFDDGPEPGEMNPWFLVAGAGLFGAAIGARSPAIGIFIIYALLTVAFVAIWYCDIKTGIVPDLFTLVPLTLFVIAAVIFRQYLAIVWALVVSLPFAIAALLSRGRGMGWGDAKIAVMGGFLLGTHALLYFGVASLAAVIASAVRNRAKPVPVAFAPYLICGIALGIVLGMYGIG